MSTYTQRRDGTKWCEEEIDLLVELRAEGKSWDYISATLKRSKVACWDKHHDYRFAAGDHSQSRRSVCRLPPLSRTDLTGIICGDPAPGRSALEQGPRRHKRHISLAPVRIGATA